MWWKQQSGCDVTNADQIRKMAWPYTGIISLGLYFLLYVFWHKQATYTITKSIVQGSCYTAAWLIIIKSEEIIINIIMYYIDVSPK